MDPQIAAALAAAQRPGWSRTGVRQHTTSKAVPDMEFGKPTGTTHTEDVPDGLEEWTIASPDGKSTDTIVVQPPPPASDVGPWAGGIGAPPPTPYQVIQGPTKQLPADSRDTSPAKPTPASGLEIIKDPTTGSPIKMRDPSTGTVIDLPAPAAGGKPSIVQGPKGSVYSWDGTNLNPLLPPQADAPKEPAKPQIVSGGNGSLYSWDGSQLNQVKPEDAAKPDVRVVGNQLVDTASGQVRYTAPEGAKFQTAQDGTILLVDPVNPTQPSVVWKPQQPPQLLPGQKPDQKDFIQQDPGTGALNKVANPIYQPAAIQQWQSLQDGITAIQGQLTRGEIDFPTAAKYKDALQQNFDASLMGTTPYQQQQDKQAAALQRAQTGASLLNQRVSAGSGLAQSLVNGAVGIAGNKNFMDPSAVQGLSIFGGANNVQDFVNSLGGGQGVQDSASGAVQTGLGGGGKPDYASALVQAALGGGQQGGAQGGASPLLPAGQAGTVPPNDPRYMGSQPGGVTPVTPIARDPQMLNDQRHMPPQQPGGYDPAAILLQAALAGGLQSY